MPINTLAAKYLGAIDTAIEAMISTIHTSAMSLNILWMAG
jgi:hypothetical protein